MLMEHGQDGYFNPRSREGSDQRGRDRSLQRQIFQSTLPRGERLLHRTFFEPFQVHFNPRSREGSDTICNVTTVPYRYFNPRSREGSDLIKVVIPLFKIIFQSTLPRGERRRQYNILLAGWQFQSTLPRGERRGYAHRQRLPIIISIHAPARGATSDRSSTSSITSYISIHAPARGAT